MPLDIDPGISAQARQVLEPFPVQQPDDAVAIVQQVRAPVAVVVSRGTEAAPDLDAAWEGGKVGTAAQTWLMCR